VTPRPGQALAGRWLGFRLPRRTIRLRLTLLYGLVFVACGAALLTVTYLLVAHQYTDQFFVQKGKTTVVLNQGTRSESSPAVEKLRGSVPIPPKILFPGIVVTQAPSPSPAQLLLQARAQSNAALHQLLIACGIALAFMALVSVWLGWLVAGRALRPLRTITNAAREISASDLHRRLDLEGPDDELKELGSTFDGLLARLESSFEAQRRFVANASHELRTPLTLERALIEVALADPNASAESLRRTLEQVLDASGQQEQLIEALLMLSRSQRGLEHYDPVNLKELASDAVDAVAGEVVVEADLEPAVTSGEPALVGRLVANLVGNAVRHNVPHGWVAVSTSTRRDKAVLSVANSGPVVPPEELERLFQPFQRLDGRRDAERGGLGLGLSIVEAIATAHGAEAVARARPQGGLVVEVSFRARFRTARPAPELERLAPPVAR
jgi:signal transduction histidine kinase